MLFQQLLSFCSTPVIKLSPNCHYSCLTCDGPNINNCLSCPLNSQRIQSITQKICTCKKKYVDIENDPICKPVSEIFPLMTEIEQELKCNFQGYDICTLEKIECSYGILFVMVLCQMCADGFYSSILNGECSKCDSNCKTCSQQSFTYQDYWKWDIKVYYKYVFNEDDLHPFETYAVSTSQNNFEIICTSCPLGYILYQKKCIVDCDIECTKCEIINRIATCIQCLETPYGFLNSQNSQGECLACPSNCGACQERSNSEIKTFNPYFLLSQNNQKYTRICYEKFNVDSPEGYYFNDQLLKTITLCENYSKCYYQVILASNIYCSLYIITKLQANYQVKFQILLRLKIFTFRTYFKINIYFQLKLKDNFNIQMKK